MFGSSSKFAANAYAKISLETGVLAADPHKLILMLFDGALMAISNGILQIQSGKIAEKSKSISHAVAIVERGLQQSLNKEVGGELVNNLDSLYAYIVARLLQANIHNDLAKLQEAHKLLGELRGAWEQIAPGKTEQPEQSLPMAQDALAPRKVSFISA